MTAPITITAATVTLSDQCAAGKREDRSGALLRDLLAGEGVTLLEHVTLPDDLEAIVAALQSLATRADVVITTGGTGLSPRDVTPEATMAVVERRIPGIEAALHTAGREVVPTAILSRAVAGMCGRCLIVNLPGSPGGVRDGFEVLRPVIHHAVRLIKGAVRDCRDDLDQCP